MAEYPHSKDRYIGSSDWIKDKIKDTSNRIPKNSYPLPPLKPLKINAFEEDVNDVAFELIDLLVRKHKDYGPLNIAQAPGGAINGLRVRMHDKMARINHLIDSGVAPSNESLEDSFADLANYAIIALMVQRGKWPTK